MLANALVWGYAFAISFVYGFCLLNLAFSKIRRQGAPSLSIFLLVLVGLAAITALAGVLSFLLPVGLPAQLVVALAGVVLATWQRRELVSYLREGAAQAGQLHPLILLAAVTMFAVVLVKTSQVAQNYDTGLYHAQAIRWIETYPVIPGLGNLHDRLAFNSSWLLLSALFSFVFLGLGSLHALDGFILLVAAGYALVHADRLLKGEISLTNAAALLLPFLLRRIFSLELSSPGTDLPAAMLVWMIFLASLERLECRRTGEADAEFWAIVLLSFFALTVKLSTLPVLLLPAVLWVKLSQRFTPALLGRGGLALLVPFAPWAARNAVLSGYLVYPLPQLDLIHPDWQIPLDTANGTLKGIVSWARTSSADWEAVSKMGLAAWAPIWYGKLEPLDRQAIWGAGLVGVLLLAWIAFQTGRRRQGPFGQVHWLYWAALAGMAYWFLNAPAMRFGMAFLGIWILLCTAPLAASALGALSCRRRAAVMLALLVFILYQGVGLYRAAGLDELRAIAILPAPYPQVAVQAHALGPVTIYTPENGDQCWYAPFPCAPHLDPHLALRGERLQDGFRVVP